MSIKQINPLPLSASQQFDPLCQREITMSYSVYILEFVGAVRNHIALFVETHPDTGTGTQFHVTGTILQGMIFDMRENTIPSEAPEYIESAKVLVGKVDPEMMGRFEDVCRAVPPPEAQLTLRGARKDPTKPIRRCGEWVIGAKEKLIAEGIIVK